MSQSITIVIADAIATDVLNAYCTFFNYTTYKLVNETKLQFAKRHLAEHVKAIYRNQVAIDAAEAAKTTSLTNTSAADIT